MATPGGAAPPEPRYTIEQISLLHRLLRTGLTKADIVHALDSMSKMDAELQAATMPLLGPASGQSAVVQSAVGQSAVGQSVVGQSVVSQSAVGHSAVGHSAISQSAVSQSIVGQSAIGQSAIGQSAIGQSAIGQSAIGQSIAGHSTVSQSVGGYMAGSHPADGHSVSGQTGPFHFATATTTMGKPEGVVRHGGKDPDPEQNGAPEVACGVENFQDVTDEELESLFRRGPMAVKSEIRLFMTKHRLSQNQISMATGISQSYISAFLIHGFKMKRSTQALLYRWYLGKRKELDGLDDPAEYEEVDSMPAVSLASRCVEVVQAYPGSASHNYLPTFKRRERFIWKESHVRIMESYYNKNPYPNDFEREKITEACNSEMQQSGVSIADNKWVTSSKVYNWFANRRKDSNRRKRLSQRMGLETSGAAHSPSGDYVAREDHTHYASTSPQHLQVIEVRHEALDDANAGEVVVEGNAGEQPNQPQKLQQQQPQQQQQVTVVEPEHDVQVLGLCMGGGDDGGPDHDQAQGEPKPTPAAVDVDMKPYDGANTIYTLIEASQETEAPKGSQ